MSGSFHVRYRDLGLLGEGSMGEVRRVHDRVADRIVACKILREDRARDPLHAARFLDEARLSARLQHPSIVPVYDVGTTDDGRPYFTMKEIAGRSLTSVLLEPEPPQLQAMIRWLQRACDAVAFAHAAGVLHRDLSPNNVLIDAHGQAYVVDWGLSESLGARTLGGTPGYIAPECLGGGAASEGSDVYALGQILRRVLGRATEVDAGLDAIAAAATARLTPERTPSAGVLGAELRRWLDGAHRQREALAHVEEARGHLARRAGHEQEIDALTSRISDAAHAPCDPAGWALQDRLEEHQHACEALRVSAELALQRALSLAPRLQEAHALLAQEHARVLGDPAAPDADRRAARTRLGEHLRALAQGPIRDALQRSLDGLGALDLHTDPPGARVRIVRLCEVQRRLQPTEVVHEGPAPLRSLPLPPGSYLCELACPGHDPVRYPVWMGHLGRWHGRPPGASTPEAIVLPPEGALGPDECYVPAGWFLAGGAPDPQSEPAGALWADGFVIQRFPVTCAQYLAFLNDLSERGQLQLAKRYSPRPHRLGSPPIESTVLPVDRHGRFGLGTGVSGASMQPDWPINRIDLASCLAYARWLAERQHRPWRLPAALEREKAARGVDGRSYPWGDHPMAAWSHHNASPGLRDVTSVYGYPIDESVYGVRGVAGNVADTCRESGTTPPNPGEQVVIVPVDEGAVLRRGTGGSWATTGDRRHCASRRHSTTVRGVAQYGLRLVYSISEAPWRR